uniref:Protein transport protein sec16 n=1 Tax=Salarias fasciatus TaxID=181472 RepID=A0A672HU46_SALFA
MQPPPRTGPPGASGPPPPSGPNMFRRTRPHKHASAAAAAMPPVTQPMTDPFAFGRAPPQMPSGGLPTIPNSSAPPSQAPSNPMYSQPGPGLPPEPQASAGIPGVPLGPPPSALPGVTLFNPHNAAPLGGFPAPGPAFATPNTEQGYFNSGEPAPSMSSEPPPAAPPSVHNQIPFNQEYHGQPPPLAAPFQPMPPTSSPSQWAPDHGSRPPSVQNYFQPTSDPQPQPYAAPPQTQMYPSHSPSPHHGTPTPPIHPGHLQNQGPFPPQNPVNAPGSQWPDPNAPPQHNSHLQTQSYFSQTSAPQDSWLSQVPQDSGYHQMSTGHGHSQPQPDPSGSQHASSTGPGPSSTPAPVPYAQESGTLSMFFKDNDVENEETLAGERNKAVNGIPGPFQHHSNPQAPSGHADVSLDYHGGAPPLQDHANLPYMNDGSHQLQVTAQKPLDSQFDHVENLECVPNQEVLPSEAPCSSAAAAPHAVDQFETGPNLETPDSIPRPIRSASVSSNYSNISHGSGTGPRRHQGVMGTFIQQESPRLADEATLSAAAGGYFEQIDTSPAGDVGVQPSPAEQMWPPTPSPPKPTGIFQASANSSFEPVRSHGVGVRPAEVDKAKMVAEGVADCAPGNMEQPPDNIENIYGSGHPLPSGAAGGTPHLPHPVVHSHSRPSSRAFGASRPCESPATTLWAQNDPSSLGANILLAPAAPTVLAPLREPSADVIQPPEDGPLDLHPSQPAAQQHSENLENPPEVSEPEPSDSQGNLGYASLLVSSSLQQPVLIAPPVSNYSVISPSTPPQAANQSSLRETTPPVRPLAQGSSASQVSSNQSPLFAPGPVGFAPSASTQGPLNLTRESVAASAPELAAQPLSQQAHPPLSRGQSQSSDSHAALQVNSQASPVTPTASNHNQPSNYELLDFSMHQSQAQSQPSGPLSSLHESPQSSNGFYLQVTKDAQQGARAEGTAPVQTSVASPGPQGPPTPLQAAPNTQQSSNEPPKAPDPQAAPQGPKDAPPGPAGGAQPPQGQYSDASYRARGDPWYGRYDGQNQAYRDPNYPYREPQPERPSSRTSQYSDRPSSRKEGYEDQWRYYPGYDASFDDDYRRRGEMYGDDFDRRSVHSEQSAHSVRSSHSHHSRRSSFSSRSHSHPPKFTMPHRCARFGPGGHLVQVLPNLPSAGQPALVDIHNLETMLQDTQDQAELRSFPGPLVKEETHKVDVIKFSQNKALECSRDTSLLDRDSARLLWDFIMLLCRQNGTVVGTDIADLLLKEHRSVWLPGKSPNEANLIDFNNEPLARAEEEPGAGPLSLLSDTFMTVPENVGKETERFRELLLFGRKKDALEAAMKGGLWGHALLLASKMDNRTHARVMTRFANSLPINDPLQTVYQLMSGRMPASATCCGEEKWGDWRPHLAMVLSNLTHTLDLDTRTITTMGDTLASKGLMDAAHFCYLMAQVGLGVFTKKSTKMVLIGSNHSLPFNQFATNEAIQRTEAYEYAQSLGSHPCSLPNFQVFKLIYACRLAEAGLSAQAFHYCEVISRTVLMQPAYYSPVFISQVIQMSEKLRFFDPQLKEKPEQELFNEPEWLIHLRQLDGQLRVSGNSVLHPRQPSDELPAARPAAAGSPADASGCVDVFGRRLWEMMLKALSVIISFLLAPTSILQDGMAPPQHLPPNDFYPVPPSGPPGPIPGSVYPPHDPGYAPPAFQPQPEQAELYPGSCPPPHMGQMSPNMLPQVAHSPVQLSPAQHVPPSPGHMAPADPRPRRTPPKRSTFSLKPSNLRAAIPFSSLFIFFFFFFSCSCQQSGGRGWLNLSWIYGKGKNEAHLPDDKNKSIVWDEQKQRWVDMNEPEEESKPPPPPPSGFPKMAPMPGPGGPGGLSAPPGGGPPVNMFSRKAGTKSRYVDVLNPSRAAKPSGLAPAPADLFAPLAPMAMTANLFVPNSGVCRSTAMFNPTLLPPAPDGAPVPDGSQSGEVRPAAPPPAPHGAPLTPPPRRDS